MDGGVAAPTSSTQRSILAYEIDYACGGMRACAVIAYGIPALLVIPESSISLWVTCNLCALPSDQLIARSCAQKGSLPNIDPAGYYTDYHCH